MSGREGKGKKSGRGRGHNRTYLDRGQTKKSSPIKIRESDEGIPILFPPQSSHHDATRIEVLTSFVSCQVEVPEGERG